MSDVTELVDKNIDKLIDAVKAAGPSAEYAFNETVASIQIEAWVEVGLAITSFIFFTALLTASLRYMIKHDSESAISFVALSTGGFVLSLLVSGLALPSSISTALHPIGYLVLKTLN